MVKIVNFICGASVLFLATIVSCGGGSKEQVNEIKRTLENNKIQCKQNKINGVYKSNVEVATCVNEKVTMANQELGYPYMDLIQLINAYRLAVAEKLDNGEITEIQAELIMAEVTQKINTEAHNRNMQRAAIIVDAYNNFSTTLGNYESEIIKTPITCFRTGPTVICQ